MTRPSDARGVQAVTAYLAEQGVAYEVVEHPRTESALAEARAAGVPPDHAAKTVVLTGEDRFWLAVVPASHQVDLDKARAALKSHAPLRLATEAEIASHTGPFEVGALPPLGPLLQALEVVDRRLLDHETILFSAGDHSHGILIDPNDLVEVVQPRVADLCRE
jgi:Ala-tRNA(Pro) deacylase